MMFHRDFPRYGYRLGKDGEVEKELFSEPDPKTEGLPEGWADSPAKVEKKQTRAKTK